MHYPSIVLIPMAYYSPEKTDASRSFTVVTLKGLIFYKVFNTGQEESSSPVLSCPLLPFAAGLL